MSLRTLAAKDPQKARLLRRRIVACVTVMREDALLTGNVTRRLRIEELLKGCPTEDEAWRPNDPTWMEDFDEAVVEWFTEGLFA